MKNGFTVNLSRFFGLNITRMADANGKMWLAFVIWYPHNRHTLGYFYPSIRWL